MCVLGNHDLHLLAVALAGARRRRNDTLDEILSAPDRAELLEWLLQRPLAHFAAGDLLVHAGVVPQWSTTQTLTLAAEVQQALRTRTEQVLTHMYGDRPKQWEPSLRGIAPAAICHQRAHPHALLQRGRAHRSQAQGQTRLG